MSRSFGSSFAILLLVLMVGVVPLAAQQTYAGIRITQTGNTGLDVDIDVTAFYTLRNPQKSVLYGGFLGIPGHVPALIWGDGSTVAPYGVGPSTGIPYISSGTFDSVPVLVYRGSFSHTYGGAGNYTILANTGSHCCRSPFLTGSPLTTVITTTSDGVPFTYTASFGQANLALQLVPPGFSKIFTPDTMPAGAISALTFTIDNAASSQDATALDFTDNLPAGVTVATPAGAATTCTGGTVTAVAGSSVISYTGGTVAAGASCTITANVTSAAPGTYLNTSGDLTSVFGNSGPASDTLIVQAAPGFQKAFLPATVTLGESCTLQFTIGNSNAVAATGLAFTDNLPAGILVANLANGITNCGGILTATPGATSIAFVGGTVAAASTCTLSVDVTGTAVGSHFNDAGVLMSSLGPSLPGTATATLDVLQPQMEEIPTTSTLGLVVLAGLLGLLAVFVLRRVRVS